MYTIRKLKQCKPHTDDIGRAVIDEYIALMRKYNKLNTPSRYIKGYTHYYCGHCNEEIIDCNYKYCPYCGGKLTEN